MTYSKPRQSSRNGPPGAGPADFYRDRRRRRHRPQVATGLNGVTLEQVVHAEALIAAFDHLRAHGGRAPGPDRLTFDRIGRGEICAILRELAAMILDGGYLPGAGRTLQIAKRLGGTRTLLICNLIDRIVAAAVARALMPGFDQIFLPCSHGFRKERGTWTLLADLMAAMAAQQSTVLAIDDIRKAFDRIPIATLLGAFSEHIEDPRLLDLIENTLRGGENRDRPIGIPQGSPLSPLALNVLLHHKHDQPLEERPEFPSRFRYADNVIYLCGDVPEGERTLDHVASILAETGLALKGEDGGATDLKEGGKAKLLGFALSIDEDRLCIELGTDALGSDMGRLMTEAHKASEPHHAARAALRGWAASYGPALGGPTGDDLEGILLAAAQHGFRELAPMGEIQEWCATAHAKWVKKLTSTFEGHGLAGTEVSFVAAPQATVEPGV